MNPTVNLNRTLFILNVALVCSLVAAAWAVFGVKGQGVITDFYRPITFYGVGSALLLLAIGITPMSVTKKCLEMTSARERLVSYILIIALTVSCAVSVLINKFASGLFSASCLLAMTCLFMISSYGAVITEFKKQQALANQANRPLQPGIEQPKATVVDYATHRAMVDRLTRELETERQMRGVADNLATELKVIVDRLGDEGVRRVQGMQIEHGRIVSELRAQLATQDTALSAAANMMSEAGRNEQRKLQDLVDDVLKSWDAIGSQITGPAKPIQEFYISLEKLKAAVSPQPKENQ